LLRGPVLMLTCPLLALSAVDRSQHGHPDWSVAMFSKIVLQPSGILLYSTVSLSYQSNDSFKRNADETDSVISVVVRPVCVLEIDGY